MFVGTVAICATPLVEARLRSIREPFSCELVSCQLRSTSLLDRALAVREVGAFSARAPKRWPTPPWQTVTPSRLQRSSVLFLHARERPPAATHAAMSSRHACRHCLPTDAASAEVAT